MRMCWLWLTVMVLSVTAVGASPPPPSEDKPSRLCSDVYNALLERHYRLRDPALREQFIRRWSPALKSHPASMEDAASICDEMLAGLDAGDVLRDPLQMQRQLWHENAERGDIGFTVSLESLYELTAKLPANPTRAQRRALLKASPNHQLNISCTSKLERIDNGDKLVRIDDVDVDAMPFDDVENMLLRSIKDETTVVVKRSSDDVPRLDADDKLSGFALHEVKLKRSAPPSCVNAQQFCNDNLMQISVSCYAPQVVAEMQEALRNRSASVKGLVLDLRGQGAGTNAMAEQLAELFVPEGILVQSHVRLPGAGLGWRTRTVRLTKTDREEVIEENGKVVETKKSPRIPFQYDAPLLIFVASDTGKLGHKLACILRAHERGIVVGLAPAMKCHEYVRQAVGDGWSLDIAAGFYVSARSVKPQGFALADKPLPIDTGNEITDVDDPRASVAAGEILKKLTGVDDSDERQQYEG